MSIFIHFQTKISKEMLNFSLKVTLVFYTSNSKNEMREKKSKYILFRFWYRF